MLHGSGEVGVSRIVRITCGVITFGVITAGVYAGVDDFASFTDLSLSCLAFSSCLSINFCRSLSRNVFLDADNLF